MKKMNYRDIEDELNNAYKSSYERNRRIIEEDQKGTIAVVAVVITIVSLLIGFVYFYQSQF